VGPRRRERPAREDLHDDVRKLRDLVATHVGPNAVSPDAMVAPPDPKPAPATPASKPEQVVPAATASASPEPPIVH
jgi:hypothetical protein